MEKALTNCKMKLILMADYETSRQPNDNDGVYAWLTGYKVCGLMDMDDKDKKWIDHSFLDLDDKVHYFYGKEATRQWLDSIFRIVDICHQNGIEVEVFFHNARYDYSYIQYYILYECNAYNNKTGNYYINPKDQLIDKNDVFYLSKISHKSRTRKGNNGKRKRTTLSFTIKDLYKILPCKLADIGDSLGYPKGEDFDYKMIRPYDYIPTKEELESYFFKDIEIMFLAYKRLFSYFYGKSTIGSIAKSLYLDKYVPKLKNNNTKVLFPIDDFCIQDVYFNGKLNHSKEEPTIPTLKVYEDIMPGYKGGMTLANKDLLGKCLYNNKLPKHLIPKVEGIKINGDIYHYDVNSLYPSVMRDNTYPIGRPRIIIPPKNTKNTEKLENYLIKEMKLHKKKIIIEVMIIKGDVKTGKAPIFLKGSQNKEYNKINDVNSYKSFYEHIEYLSETLTLDEFLVIKENYNLKYRIKKAYIFKSMEGLFTDFIEELSKLKIEYDKDEFKRLLMKLLMNNLYGKFGERTEKESLYRGLDDQGDWLKGVNSDKNDNTTNTTIKNTSKPFYPPIAIFITSYARIKMIEYINLVGWDNVLYMDTDSLHIIGEENKRVLEEHNLVHDTKLGHLKLEDICYAERVLSPKKYCYYGLVMKKQEVKFSVKCAGLPGKAQKEIKTFDQFYYGLTFIPESLLNEDKTMYRKKVGDNWEKLPDNCLPIDKLVQRHVKGGIYLKPCIFSIQVPEYIRYKNNLQLDKFDIETILL